MTHKLLSEKINEMLRPLFCPRTADEEKHLSDLITSVMQSNCTSLLEINCLTLTHENTAAMSPTKCSTVSKLKEKMDQLKLYVREKLSAPQLKVLLAVGFCMELSPYTAKTSVETQLNSMVVCTGSSTPYSGGSVFYVPSEDSITKDLLLADGYISALPDVALVTIARSYRDGYVPRKFQPQIETGLKNLLSSFSANQNLQLNFALDPHLMRRRS